MGRPLPLHYVDQSSQATSTDQVTNPDAAHATTGDDFLRQFSGDGGIENGTERLDR